MYNKVIAYSIVKTKEIQVRDKLCKLNYFEQVLTFVLALTYPLTFQ